jgi:hypothetical protein
MVNKAAGLLDRKSSRRGFILGSAMVGSAVAVAGCVPATQPGSLYKRITDCAGGLCTDGYTEFCCTINNGVNACPSGSFIGGWWRADYSSFCNGTRYYMDCMQNCCGPAQGNGFCAGCTECKCASGCDTRRVYCNYFRYGQCHQEIGITGPIACRVVTCTPPYTIADYACSTVAAVDNSTAEHAPAHGCEPPKSYAAVLPSAGAVVSSSSGKLTAFGRLSDSTMALQEFNGSGWSTASIPFAICSSNIAATSNGSTTVAFVKSNNGGYWWNRRPNGGSWSSSWVNIGGNFISDPAMASDATGVYAFGRGADDGVWYSKSTGSSFSGPAPLGGIVTSDPWAVADATGLYVFARGTDRAIYYRRFVSGNPGLWTSLGGTLTSDPMACGTASGPIVVARGTDNAVWVRYVSGQNGNTWQWTGGKATSDPAICSGPAGTFLFVRSNDNAIWYSKFNGGTSWGPWTKLGGSSSSSPIAISDSAGVSVLFVGTDRALRTFRFANGSWGPEQSIRGGLAPVRGGS